MDVKSEAPLEGGVRLEDNSDLRQPATYYVQFIDAHLNDVKDERGAKHVVQLDFVIGEDVLQTASCAVLRDDEHVVLVHTRSHEWVQVVVTHVSHL